MTSESHNKRDGLRSQQQVDINRPSKGKGRALPQSATTSQKSRLAQAQEQLEHYTAEAEAS